MGLRSYRIAFALGLIASSGAVISACSSDDEEPQGNAGTGTGATGGTGAGGTSGRGGSSGTGVGATGGTGAGATGGTGGMGSITCGTKTCQPGGLGFIPACCIANERCGIDPPELTVDGGDLPCTEVDQPGTPDPTCFAGQGIDLEDAGIDAAGFIDGGRLTVPGCCRPNGMCGIIIDVPVIGLNLGCIDPAQYGAIYDAGPPQRCGDAGGGNDVSVDSSTGDSSDDSSVSDTGSE
jgi:hypothetical protein